MRVWTAYVRQDGDDLIIPLPDDLFEQLDWKVGDALVWDVQEDGRVFIRKKPKWYHVLWSKVKSWRK